jgi:UDPglucose 6-dehydrogenase
LNVVSRPVCIIGTGYVGMACTLGLAELGWRVHGYDILPDRIERLRLGIPPYREPGIVESLREHIDRGRIAFFDKIDAAARDAEVIIVAVGTPARDDGSADLSALRAAIDQLSNVRFTSWPTIVIRSTVPPGTSDALAVVVERWADLIYAPEFLREGSAVRDFLNPDRIIVGSDQPSPAVRYVQLLERLQRRIVFTSRCNAELIKGCSNAFLALKISFANEVANMCDALGATSDDVLRGIGYDHRIGSDFLRPGIGFGGPCFEKDVKSMAYVAEQNGLGRELFSATLRVNEAQPRQIIKMLELAMPKLADVTLGIWGLAFKAGTDDIRDSLALRIVEELGRRGVRMIVYDPAVRVAPLPAGSTLVTSALEATHADALLVLTEWPEFARIDPLSYAANLARRIVIDGRNVLDSARVAAAGLAYRGVGRSEHGRFEPARLEPLALSTVRS